MNTISQQDYRRDFLDLVNTNASLAGLKAELDSNRVKLADHALFAAKGIGGATTIKIIDPTINDDRVLGLRNFDRARLDARKFFMPTSVQLLFAVGGGAITDTLLKTLRYGSVSDAGAAEDGTLENGEVNFRINNLFLFQDMPIAKFVTAGNGNVRVGEHEIIMRRIITPNDPMDFEIRLGAPAPANAACRIIIHGIQTVPFAA